MGGSYSRPSVWSLLLRLLRLGGARVHGSVDNCHGVLKDEKRVLDAHDRRSLVNTVALVFLAELDPHLGKQEVVSREL